MGCGEPDDESVLSMAEPVSEFSLSLILPIAMAKEEDHAREKRALFLLRYYRRGCEACVIYGLQCYMVRGRWGNDQVQPHLFVPLEHPITRRHEKGGRSRLVIS